MQQRGIAPTVVETLLDHGTVQHDHHGGRIVYFSRAARRRLLRAGEVSAAQLERWRQDYLVLTGDGRVRTACWRYRPIRRH